MSQPSLTGAASQSIAVRMIVLTQSLFRLASVPNLGKESKRRHSLVNYIDSFVSVASVPNTLLYM